MTVVGRTARTYQTPRCVVFIRVIDMGICLYVVSALWSMVGVLMNVKNHWISSGSILVMKRSINLQDNDIKVATLALFVF